MAASFALRIQSLVAHEAATPTAPVLTVGALHAGTAANIIADEAELLLSLRTFSATSRENMLESVRRIARAEADGAGAVDDAGRSCVQRLSGHGQHSGRHVHSDGPTCDRPAWECTLCHNHFQVARTSESSAPPPNAPPCSGIFGGTALQSFDGTALAALAEGRIPPGTPSNHSPRFAPDPAAALPEGVTAMTAAALGALARSA